MSSFGRRRCVFLDRDGVINEALVRGGKAFSPRSREEFVITPEVGTAIQHLKQNDFCVIVVTNQPDIARGKLPQTDLDWMTGVVLGLSGIDEVMVCPHDEADNCCCRKPKPGMLLGGAEKWGIDLAESYLIGDSWKDMGAGQHAGCTCILLDRSYNQDAQCDYRVENLNEAVQIILNT